MNLDFHDRAVLISEGAAGLGLYIALAFARRGAACILTTGDAAVDEAGVLRRFAQAGATAPTLARVDTSRGESLEARLQEVRARHERIEAFIHAPQVIAQTGAVACAPATFEEFAEEYSRRDFTAALENRAWSLVEHVRAVKRVFGAYPHYVVGLAGTSTLEYCAGADFAAASEAALESLCRYMNSRLFEEEVRVNVLRYRNVSLDTNETDDPARKLRPSHYNVSPEEVANAAVALCSGLMDCMSGHVLTVDRGTTFFDNLMRLYTEREQYGL